MFEINGPICSHNFSVGQTHIGLIFESSYAAVLCILLKIVCSKTQMNLLNFLNQNSLFTFYVSVL